MSIVNEIKENYTNPLNDREFLNKLFSAKAQTKFVRITLLNFQEQPISWIEGSVTQGSVNVDGNSSVRHTCSLTFVTEDFSIDLSRWGLNKKFKLEIGIENTINEKYSNPAWFNMGLYILTSINSSRSTNGYTISISGKDKMCLLNGDIGGQFPFISSDLSVFDELSENGSVSETKKIPLYNIIYQLVENYGGELPQNILINIDDLGLELLQYNGDTPIYVLKEADTNDSVQYYINGKQLVYYANSDDETYVNLNRGIALANIQSYQLDFGSSIVETLLETDPATFYQLSPAEREGNTQDRPVTVMKFEEGEAVGYHQTDLIYPGELIGNIGESVTSVLDKIKQMLGDNYTYFYDLEGKFHFQKKTRLANTLSFFTNNPEAEKMFDDTQEYTAYNTYSFEDNEKLISVNNTPDYSKVKNDYSIWGTRKGVDGTEIPIHLRFAIDAKPIRYTTYKDTVEGLRNSEKGSEYSIARAQRIIDYTEQVTYITDEDGSYNLYVDNEGRTICKCDWREVLYQMALDYHYYHDTREDFQNQIRNNTVIVDEDSLVHYYLYPEGKTGYEQYYTDIISFWRDLFCPTTQDGFYKTAVLTEETYKKNTYYVKEDNDYDLIGRFPVYKKTSKAFNESTVYYEKVEDEPVYRNKFKKVLNIRFSENVIYYPYSLNFWIDFLDSEGDISKFSVRQIGQRGKNVSDSQVAAIYYRTIPNLIYVPSGSNLDGMEKSTAYTYVRSSANLETAFSTSAQGVGAWDYLQTLLNENTYAQEQISLVTIPLYFLEPNEQILIKDERASVTGVFEIQKITFPLDYKSNSTITAARVLDDII